REEKPLRRQAEEMSCSRRMGKAGLAKDIPQADPEDRELGAGVLRLRRLAACGKRGKRQGEARSCAGIAGLGADDLRERSAGQAAAKRVVESLRPSCHKRWVQLFAGNDPALPPDENASGTVPVGLFMRTSALGRFEVLGQGALDLRDFAAQGTNPRPRHGAACHAVPLRQSNVLVMFLSIPEDGPRVKGAC